MCMCTLFCWQVTVLRGRKNIAKKKRIEKFAPKKNLYMPPMMTHSTHLHTHTNDDFIGYFDLIIEKDDDFYLLNNLAINLCTKKYTYLPKCIAVECRFSLQPNRRLFSMVFLYRSTIDSAKL